MPHVAVADTSSSAASLLNGLQAAANQQATQQRLQQNQQNAQQQQTLADQLRILSEGGIAADTITQEPGGSGLKVRQPNPAAGSDPSRIVTNGDGKRYYMPTAEEKDAKKRAASLDDTNSIIAPPGSGLEKMLQAEANIQPGTRIPLAHISGLMGLHKALAAEAEAQARRKQVARVNGDAVAKGKAVGFDLNEGDEVPFGQMNEFMQALQPKEKPEKEVLPRIETAENDRGDKTTIAYHPTTGAEMWRNTAKGIGHTRRDPEDVQRAVEQRFEQRERNRDQSTIDSLTKLEGKQHETRATVGAFLGALGKAKDGDSIVLPDSKAAIKISPKVRESLHSKYQAKFDAATQQTENLQQQKAALVNRHNGGGQPNTGEPAGSTAAKQPVTMQHVRNYAAQKFPNDPKGEAKAIREFQQYGYQIGK